MAFARLSFVKLKPDVSLEETRKIWDESVIPAAKEQKGLIGGLYWLRRKENKHLRPLSGRIKIMPWQESKVVIIRIK